MAILNRDSILQAPDQQTEVVDVPEWGGSVVVSAMSGSARDEWQASLIRSGTKGEVSLENVTARLLVFCLLDDSGHRLFNLESADQLGAKSASALDRLAKVAKRLNKIGDEELEVARKNSTATPGDDSPSA